MLCLPVVKRGMALGLIVTCVLLLSACRSGPPPRLYLLEPVVEPAPNTVPESITALGMSVVTLPSYANDERIATRLGDVEVVLDDAHRWAESPEDALTRVLAQRLRIEAGATVLVEPWPRGFEPQARVDVEFDTLLRTRDGGVEMAGQVRLLSGDGRSVIGVRPFRLEHYAGSDDPAAFFPATAAGVHDVARIALQALSASP